MGPFWFFSPRNGSTPRVTAGSPRRRRAAPRRPRARLALEALEERAVPATLVVNTTLDTLGHDNGLLSLAARAGRRNAWSVRYEGLSADRSRRQELYARRQHDRGAQGCLARRQSRRVRLHYRSFGKRQIHFDAHPGLFGFAHKWHDQAGRSYDSGRVATGAGVSEPFVNARNSFQSSASSSTRSLNTKSAAM